MSARKKKSQKKPTLSISSKCLGSEMISEEIQLPDTLGLEPAFLSPHPSHSEKGIDVRCEEPRRWTRVEQDLHPGSVAWLVAARP